MVNVFLDNNRMKSFRGTPLEEKIHALFGGKLKVLQVSVPDDVSKTLLSSFNGVRVDSRGFIEGLPVSYKRALYSEIVSRMTLSREVFDGLAGKLNDLQEEAKLETEYVPPP